MTIMKKLLFVLFLMTCLTSSAQSIVKEGASYPVYCFVHGYEDWGELKALVEMNQKGKSSYLCNLDDEPVVFNSVPQILTYMSKLGWVYVESVVLENTLHFVMKKEVKSDEEALENMKLLSNSELKKIRKEKGLD